MALDSCEPQVIHAFEKAGWFIHAKPYKIRTTDRTVYADISFQRTVADHIEQIIILEIKCFADPGADLQELYTAVGQYQYYSYALQANEIRYPLYLIIPAPAYHRLLNDSTATILLKTVGIKIVVVDIEAEEITTWLI